MNSDYPRSVRVLVADPPWKFNDTLPGPKRGAAKHYPVLDLDTIKNFPLPKFHRESAWLFLWRVAAMQEEALEVMYAWGFTPKAEMVWIKTSKAGSHAARTWFGEGVAGDDLALAFGMGHYVRGSHEVCMIGVRGSPKPRTRSQRSVFFAPRRDHSEKPEAFYGIVRSLTKTPRVELFARTSHKGFHCFGDELNKLL